uniref:ATP synthase 8 n=1 Tax=Proasellus hercegovinensis TaxID=1281977 RepID=A0A485M7G5_9CRUS|nr:ATP synthase 8 [Proasellus hercegovinensis]
MAPLMWYILLTLFYSTLILFMVKLYFYSSETTALQSSLPNKPQEPAWLW